MRGAVAAAGLAPAETSPDVATAFRRAQEIARPDDRILIFGSFLTVSAVLALTDGPHR
jgi:folylpolyglutamate synthase/dihydropteroate synthase